MLPLRKFEKNRMAHFRELDHILDFGHEVSRPGKGDGAGPSPLLKVPKFPKKRRPPMERQCGIRVLAILSTKGGRPRPPTVGERGPKLFHTYGFPYIFGKLIRV